MKALIFSDLHIHSHKERTDRLQNCLAALEWAFTTAEKENCDYIFFLGDLFHERAKIDVLNYLRTFEIFMKYLIERNPNKQMLLLVGNHDMYHKEYWDINSIKPLSAIPNVSIIQSPLTMHVGSRRIDWLPYTDNPIKDLTKLKKDGVGDILLTHIAVHGAMTNTFYGVKSDVIVEYDNEMTIVDPSIFDDWKMTFIGHYHGAQKLNNKVEYVGSPLQLSFGEAFQEKHIIVLDLETLEKKYIVNNFSPKHLIVTPQDIEHEAYDLEGQFVRVSVDNMGQKDLLDLQQKVKKLSPLSVGFKQIDKKSEEKDIVAMSDAKAILQDRTAMLLRYMKDRGVPEGLDEKHLLNIGEQCAQEIIS